MRDTANFEMVSGVFTVVCKKVPKHNNEFTPGKIYKAYAYISNNPGVNWFIFNDLVIPGSIRFGKCGCRTTSNTDCFEISVYNTEIQPQLSPTEQVLSKDWNTPEEDKAWKDLQEPKIGDVIGEITYGGRGKPFIPKDEEEQEPSALDCKDEVQVAEVDIPKSIANRPVGGDEIDLLLNKGSDYNDDLILHTADWKALSPEGRHNLNVYVMENEKIKKQLEIALNCIKAISPYERGEWIRNELYRAEYDIAALDEEQS